MRTTVVSGTHTHREQQLLLPPLAYAVAAAVASGVAVLQSATAIADETCNSPYVTRLIKGQEDYVHVRTLGVKGLGDESDKLVTVDVNPKSKNYGRVVHTVSAGGRGEAHHLGFTDDRKYLWAGRLDDNKIFVFDVGTNPAKPKLVKTISNLSQKTGYVGPHTFYALPGRMLIQALSNTKDHGGITGMAVYNNKGDYVAKYDMPTATIGGAQGDGYGYDIGINPAKNVLLTSSFTGWNNYMMDMGKLFHWDGKELQEQWAIDFYKEKLGRAHHMKFTAAPAKTALLGAEGERIASTR